MEILIGIIVIVVVLILIGKAKGAPEPTNMSFESLLARIQSEEAWIEKYKRLPYKNQQGEGIKKQYHEKKIYVMELNLELMKKGVELRGDTPDEAMFYVLKKSITLMKSGVDPDEAMEMAKKPITDRQQELLNSGMSEEEVLTKIQNDIASGKFLP
jgi:rRNA processing protein Krr1/Pno1